MSVSADREVEWYCPNEDCGNAAMLPPGEKPGPCSGCGAEMEEYEEHIPEGCYLAEDLDGCRIVKK